jgi:hypothetical protein
MAASVAFVLASAGMVLAIATSVMTQKARRVF